MRSFCLQQRSWKVLKGSRAWEREQQRYWYWLILENIDIGIDVSIGIRKDKALGIPIDVKLLRIVLMHVGPAPEWFCEVQLHSMRGTHKPNP